MTTFASHFYLFSYKLSDQDCRLQAIPGALEVELWEGGVWGVEEPQWSKMSQNAPSKVVIFSTGTGH